MSVKIIAEVWAMGFKHRSELLIMLAIADFSNDYGYCWPSIETLAKKSLCSDRGVQKALSSLVKRGKLVIKRYQGPHGTNLYRVITNRGVNPVHPPELSGPPSSPKPSGTVSTEKKENKKKERSNMIDFENHTPPPPEGISKLHATYCQESKLDLQLDTGLDKDRWGRKRAWHTFMADGFTESDLVMVIRHIRRTMKEPFRTKCLNFRKLIENTDYFGEQLAEAKAMDRNSRKPLSNRDTILKATHRLTDSIPEPKTPKSCLPDPAEFAEGLKKVREAL